MGAGPSREEPPPPTAELNIHNGNPKKPTQESEYIAKKAVDEPNNMMPVEEPRNVTTKLMDKQVNGSKKHTEEKEKMTNKSGSTMDGAVGSAANNISSTTSNQKRKRFWVDERTGHKCFALFARDLSITWSEDIQYWHWVPTDDAEIELVSLLNVCWLEVHGKFDTSHLTPGITYQVAFVVMIKDPAYGWETPINLRLKFGDGRVQESKVCLKEKPRGKWIELEVGEIAKPLEQPGEVEISLFEYEGGHWKRGLIIKSIIILPKN